MTWLQLLEYYFFNKRYVTDSCRKTKAFKKVQKKVLKEAVRLLRKNL